MLNLCELYLLLPRFIVFLFVNFYILISSKEVNDVYKHSATDIKGNELFLEEFRGKVTLFVNVATYCGYTKSHYNDLVKMHAILGHKKEFSVLAFPCNQFGQQEPDTNEEIQEFVQDIYKVNFPIFSKIDVIGENAHPVYKNLKEQSGKEPTWNFWKYLVNHRGKVINAWGPEVTVEDLFDEVKNAIEGIENTSKSTMHSEEL